MFGLVPAIVTDANAPAAFVTPDHSIGEPAQATGLMLS